MWLGMRALKFSADCAMENVTGVAKEKKDASPAAMALQIGFSLVFMIGLYKCCRSFSLPSLAATSIRSAAASLST